MDNNNEYMNHEHEEEAGMVIRAESIEIEEESVEAPAAEGALVEEKTDKKKMN